MVVDFNQWYGIPMTLTLHVVISILKVLCGVLIGWKLKTYYDNRP